LIKVDDLIAFILYSSVSEETARRGPVPHVPSSANVGKFAQRPNWNWWYRSRTVRVRNYWRNRWDFSRR